MFRAADLVLLTKSDFLDMIDDFDTGKAERHVRELANPAHVLTLSVRRPDSLEGWLAWLRQMLEARQGGEKLIPKIQPNGASLHM
jgi:hydrogenase nickel incorporation protein HypB